MMNAADMFHYVYMITDKITNEKYIGIRSCTCDPFEDDYMGSGTLLKDIDKKTLRKDILTVTPDRSSALAIETLLVNDHFVNRSDTLNIRTGGEKQIRSIEYASRQMEGIAKAKAEGRFNGRPSRISKEKVFDLYNKGLKHSEIAEQLDCSRPSVYRILGG